VVPARVYEKNIDRAILGMIPASLVRAKNVRHKDECWFYEKNVQAGGVCMLRTAQDRHQTTISRMLAIIGQFYDARSVLLAPYDGIS